LVFPEYAGIESVWISTPDRDRGPNIWCLRMAEAAWDWQRMHSDLAVKYGVHILAGSLCVAEGRAFVNRAFLVSPDGKRGWQDKMIPTPYERQVMNVTGRDSLRLFDTALRKIGVLICYDSEFPLLARGLIAADADMLLVPGCSELTAGQTRVRQSCRARAIEGQSLVVQSPLKAR
jgi:predicted amidohydrolase